MRIPRLSGSKLTVVNPLPAWFGVLTALAFLGSNPALGASTNIEQGELLSKEGKVDWSLVGADWSTAAIGQKLHVRERLRTLDLSRAMVRLAELGRVRINEITNHEI